MGDLTDKSFEILVREHHRRLMAYALSMVRQESTAQDLVQESFVTAYQNLSRFDVSKDFGSWVRGIIRMKYQEWIREKRETPVDEATLEVLDRRHLAWESAQRNDGISAIDMLVKCLDTLPDTVKGAIDLFYFKKLPCEAIAVETGANEVSVRQRLSRGRQMLLGCVKDRMKSDAALGEA